MVRPIENNIVESFEAQRIETQSLVAENVVAQNTAGADSLRGEFLLQQSVFKFRLQTTDAPASVASAPAVDQQKVDAAVKLIHEKLDESGWFNDVTHSELEDIERTINDLSPGEATAVFNKLSDADLKKWADELDSNGWFGTGGFDGGEKQGLFQMLAGKLDGQNLARFAAALSGEDNLRKFGEAVAGRGSDAAKEGFVRAAAAKAESDPATALAVAETIASMKNNPAALERTLGALTQTQIDKIVEAATQKHQYTSTNWSLGGPPSATTTITYNAAPLGRMLDAVASVGDPKLKARFFEPAARQLKEIEEAGSVIESIGGINYFKGESVSQIRNGLTNILNSDTTGVVGALETMPDSYTGKGLTAYLKSMLASGQEKQVGEFVTRMLLGNDLKGNAVERFRAQTPGTSGDSLYDNAENLGYFLGAVRSAAKQISDDMGKQADFVKNIFGAVLGAVGAAGTGPGVAAAGLGWLSSELINGVSNRMKDGKMNIYDALIQLGLPRVDANTIYDGPAEAAFKSAFSFVVDNG